MIDYNYYTTLDNKDLEKIISHVKNIQHQRITEFENLFFSCDIPSIILLLPNINKNQLINAFNSFENQFNDSPKSIDFYIFLKKNEYTKDFDFNKIENLICFNFATPKILDLIKQELPETFESFSQKTFQYSNKELINYLHLNNFINFEALKQSNTISNPMISYMLKENIFQNFDSFPFYQWFPSMNEESLNNVRNYFKLDKLNFEEIYLKSNELLMKSYMKDTLKYKTPDFLENFIINPFFVKEFSSSIDKVSDKFKPTDFILKMFALIKEQNSSEHEDLINALNSNVKKPINKELLSKAQLNFSLDSSLIKKDIKSSLSKI